VEGVAWEFHSPLVESGDGAVLIPPGLEIPETVIGVRLWNTRGYPLAPGLINHTETRREDAWRIEQSGPEALLIRLEGAREGDTYAFTVELASAGGLRVFQPYTLPFMRCVSFETGLASLTYRDGAGQDRALVWNGLWEAYAGDAAYGSPVTITARPVQEAARLAINGVLGNSLTLDPLHEGMNEALLEIEAPSGSRKTYRILFVVQGEPSGVIVDFTKPGDEHLDLSDAGALSWSADTPIILRVSGAYRTYQWYMNSQALSGEDQSSLSAAARGLAALGLIPPPALAPLVFSISVDGTDSQGDRYTKTVKLRMEW
jgi:hypothetical protein